MALPSNPILSRASAALCRLRCNSITPVAPSNRQTGARISYVSGLQSSAATTADVVAASISRDRTCVSLTKQLPQCRLRQGLRQKLMTEEMPMAVLMSCAVPLTAWNRRYPSLQGSSVKGSSPVTPPTIDRRPTRSAADRPGRRSPTPDRSETLPTLIAGVISRLRELSADLLDMIDRRWNEDTRIDARIQRSESPWEYATSWNAG